MADGDGKLCYENGAPVFHGDSFDGLTDAQVLDALAWTTDWEVAKEVSFQISCDRPKELKADAREQFEKIFRAHLQTVQWDELLGIFGKMDFKYSESDKKLVREQLIWKVRDEVANKKVPPTEWVNMLRVLSSALIFLVGGYEENVLPLTALLDFLQEEIGKQLK